MIGHKISDAVPPLNLLSFDTKKKLMDFIWKEIKAVQRASEDCLHFHVQLMTEGQVGSIISSTNCNCLEMK